MLDDHDDGARIGIWVALGVVALLVFGLVTGLAWRAAGQHKAPARPAAAAEELLDVALSGDLVGKIYFELGKSELPADVAQALGDALAATTADSGKRLMLSGFHDPSGDPAKNAELAKERAKAVREALKAHGVAADRIVLRKPEQTAADGPPADARRVEIRLVGMP